MLTLRPTIEAKAHRSKSTPQETNPNISFTKESTKKKIRNTQILLRDRKKPNKKRLQRNFKQKIKEVKDF